MKVEINHIGSFTKQNGFFFIIIVLFFNGHDTSDINHLAGK